MEAIREAITNNMWLAWAALLAAFGVLAKCADLFVDSSVRLANRFGLPKLVIGIVLVSLATTAPELAVSLVSAIRGNPEMALGNAIGSVICNAGLALGCAGIVLAAPVVLIPRAIRTSGAFLIGIAMLAIAFVARDYTLSRIEGIVLVIMFALYLAVLIYQHRDGHGSEIEMLEGTDDTEGKSLLEIAALFLLALAGILLSSEFVVTCASAIAEKQLHVPKSVIALTLVAFGTSVPEVATCIAAARKNEGAIAVGNILGANIMNICWVAGASAIANDLTLGKREVYFMFPVMLAIVLTMLGMLRYKYRLTRTKGALLLGIYAVYLVLTVVFFPPA